MTNDLSILKTASAMATHAARRHAVIADNIANANTPGFKAKDVTAFADLYKRAGQTGESLATVTKISSLIETSGASKPNGNSVSLEGQMINSAQAVGEHDLATLLYRKTLDMMKLAIGKNI